MEVSGRHTPALTPGKEPVPIVSISSTISRIRNILIFFPPSATTPIGGCILQPSSGL